jgi:uncharacterized protein YciI
MAPAARTDAGRRGAAEIDMPTRRPARDTRPTLFVIELSYTAPLEEIDAHMRDHVAFLDRWYASGHFLVSGRKIPREGGVILAVGSSREEIEAIARDDPFCARGLADYRIVEFRASQHADDIQRRIERGAR